MTKETITLENGAQDAGQLATYFAKKITSQHNQHVIIMVVGSAGTGKSWAALNLATETAKEVARIIGGNPVDYFNLKDNVGIITREDIKRVLTNPKKYAILQADDAAVAWNARKFKDDFNMFLNDILQTFRPNNNLVILTLQADFLVDRVPRSLAHYLIEMEQAYFDYGMSIAKVFKVNLKHRIGQIHHEYIVEDAKYIRHIFYAPDKSVTDEYEQLRAENLKKLNEMKEETKAIPVSKADILFDTWANLKSEGYSYREIGRITNTDHGHISKVLRSGGVV